ncbi:putative myosin light chain kinase [Tolypocladium ophioglossoides CBS 100239]|uniref:Putative myosin light chain kinase n=1 Tax=Tolypocladium ophioglossoides (strain CBS 100239) TaxID=1163406 RepID=A0A0L0NGK6_TOLOC|nr:putative myosin light chain kinase [Tolypocladium ophioglossoides CBS 100239]
MKKAAPHVYKRALFDYYKIFTHGGNYWRDDYHLRYWDDCIQPVVYRNSTYGGYKLLRRLGDWCWLTNDPKPQDYLTVKFLSRGQVNDLKMGLFLKQHCRSPLVATMKDHFTMPHHLAQIDSKYQGINFDAIVYETTGADMRRESPYEEPYFDTPMSLDRRQRCIQQVVQAVAELHRIGVVHGDLHPGNVALPPPTREHIDQFLTKPPLEHKVIRKDEEPTPAHLPQLVTEPENIGYGDGDIKLFDFGYAFQAIDGVAYDKSVFAPGTPAAPELLTDKKITQPFKAESWYLGQLIYFVLLGGVPVFRGSFWARDESDLEVYDLSLDAIESGQDEFMNELPEELRLHFSPYIMALLEKDPDKRLSIEDLSKDERFMRKVD